jgi:hypothetical protein
MRRIVGCLLITATAFSASAQQTPKAPTAHFSQRGLAVSGATPGAHVAVIGIGMRPGGYYGIQFKWSGILDCDRDGNASIDFGFDVPPSSVWGVVDGSTGEASLLVPNGAAVPQARLHPDAFRRAGGTVSQFAFHHPVLELLYVEPGGGAWVASTEDGAKTDRDGPNGVSVSSLRLDAAMIGQAQ